MNALDKMKPTLKDGETLCDGCWNVGTKDKMQGWFFVNFKHLKAMWVCNECAPEVADHLVRCQAVGL